MKGHGSKFSRKMEEAVAALLTHRNHEEAARAVGIGTATLLRWQKEPEFRRLSARLDALHSLRPLRDCNRCRVRLSQHSAK